MSILAAIRALLTRREKFKVLIALFAVLCSGLFQVFGVGSILPFVALLGNPKLVHTNNYLNWTYTTLALPARTTS